MPRHQPLPEHVVDTLHGIRSLYSNRSGLDIYRTLARVWVEEREIIGRSPNINLRALGRELNLDDSVIALQRNSAEFAVMAARRAVLPRPIRKGGRPQRWVVETENKPKIVTI